MPVVNRYIGRFAALNGPIFVDVNPGDGAKALEEMKAAGATFAALSDL